MLSLIFKDIIIQKKMIIFSVFYSFILLFSFKGTDFRGLVSMMGGTGIGYLFILTAMGFDDKNKSEIIINSLPIKRENVVLSRYLSTFIYIAIAVIIIGGIGAIVKAFGLMPELKLVDVIDIVSIVLSLGILSSIYYPMYYKYGAQNLKLVNIILFLGAFFAPPLAIDHFKGNKTQSIGTIMDILNSIPDSVMGLVILGITFVIMVISYYISVFIYKRKEF